MEFVCTKNNFLRGIQIVECAIGRAVALPILQNVFVQTEENKLNLITTDLEVGISAWIPAKIKKEGNVMVPLRAISSFIRSLPNDNIEGKYAQKIFCIKNAQTTSRFKTEDASNFPLLPNVERDWAIEVDGGEFAQNITKVVNTASLLGSKPELTGVFIKFSPNEIIYAATDSFRLAEKQSIHNRAVHEEKKIIIPLKTAQDIIRIFQQDSSHSPLICYSSSNQIVFEYNPNEQSYLPKTSIVSRLIEGNYPEYNQIIPKTWKTKIIVPRVDLLGSIKSASLFTNKLQEIRFTVNSQSNNIVIQTQNYDMGDYSSNLHCEIEGEEQNVLFNLQYILDGLQNMEDSHVVMKINERNTPIVLEPLNAEQKYKYIIMPIKEDL